MKIKNNYAAPEAEVIELRLEHCILDNSDGSWSNSMPSSTTWDSADDDYGLE